MANDAVSFFLRMKDEATTVWDKFHNKVAADSKRVTETIKTHWVGLSVSIASIGFALNKAFGMAEAGAKLEQVQAVFKDRVERMGLDATAVFEDIRKKSAGMIDDDAIMASANKAMAMNIPVDRLGELMMVARDRARAMGITVEDAFDKITLGVGRGAARMLKSVGILVDIKQATKEYADEQGLAGDEMTSAADKLALLNEISEKYYKTLDIENLNLLTNYEKFQKIRAQIDDVKDKINEVVLKAGIVMVSFFEKLGALFNLFLAQLFGVGSAIEMFFAGFGVNIGNTFSKLTVQALAAWGHLEKSSKETLALMDADLKNTGKNLEAFGDTGSESTKMVAGSMEALVSTQKKFNDELSKLLIHSDAYRMKLVQVKLATDAVNDAQRMQAFQLDLLDKKYKSKSFDNSPLKKMVEDGKKLKPIIQGITDKELGDLKLTFDELVADEIKGIELIAAFSSAAESGFAAVGQAIDTGFRQQFEKVFGEANSLLEIFIENFMAQLMQIAASSVFKLAMNFVTGGGAGFLGFLFHEGGTVPKAHGGMYIDAPPSVNVPIIARGGETIRTEKQEADLQRSGGITIIVNSYGPISDEEAFKRIVENGLRKTGLSVMDYFRNDRGSVALG